MIIAINPGTAESCRIAAYNAIAYDWRTVNIALNPTTILSRIALYNTVDDRRRGIEITVNPTAGNPAPGIPISDGESVKNTCRCLAAVEGEPPAGALAVDNAGCSAVFRLKCNSSPAKFKISVTGTSIDTVGNNNRVTAACAVDHALDRFAGINVVRRRKTAN